MHVFRSYTHPPDQYVVLLHGLATWLKGLKDRAPSLLRVGSRVGGPEVRLLPLYGIEVLPSEKAPASFLSVRPRPAPPVEVSLTKLTLSEDTSTFLLTFVQKMGPLQGRPPRDWRMGSHHD